MSANEIRNKCGNDKIIMKLVYRWLSSKLQIEIKIKMFYTKNRKRVFLEIVRIQNNEFWIDPITNGKY